MASSRAEQTRAAWLAVLDKYKFDADRPGAKAMWSPRLDGASRDEIVAIQNAKLAAVDALPLREQRLLPAPLRSAGPRCRPISAPSTIWSQNGRSSTSSR